MAFDPDRLLAKRVALESRWQVRDTLLYALGVGADDLRFVYEDGLVALPTMAVVLGYPGFDFWRDPALGIDHGRILHGETEIELPGPLPTAGDFTGHNAVEAIYDKGPGKGAVVRLTRALVDGQGNHLATVRNTSFLRGNGGFGGSSEGQPKPHPVPDDRPADTVVTIATAANQAMLYRLSGDYNPLHIDPAMARTAGFPAPILHGLCTYGVVGRAVLQALCDNDPARLRRLGVRFSSPVYPGETIRTEFWHEGDGRAAFRASVAERGLVVLNNGVAEFA